MRSFKSRNMQVVRTMIMIVLMVLTPPVSAAELPDALFQSDEVLNVELTAPLSTLIRERPQDEYLEGSILFRDADGTWVKLDPGIRARGNFRHANCDFPPLTLNFKKSQVEGTLFDGQDKLKMVVHCKDSGRYAQSVLREYLAYRLLNVLTDQSFRVRLLQVAYEDSDERRSRMVRYAFLIEHKKRLGYRIGRESLDVEQTDISSIQPDHLNLTTLFQFLIGNTDFSPVRGGYDECCHNYELFGNGDEPLLSIPYDFDNAGLVNAPYAEPAEWVDIENVQQRAYLGYCANNTFVEGSISRFQNARDELYAQVAELQGLESSVRDSLVGYMDEFFEIIGDPAAVERQIISGCI